MLFTMGKGLQMQNALEALTTIRSNQIYRNLGREDYYTKIFAQKDYLIEWGNNQWNALTLLT